MVQVGFEIQANMVSIYFTVAYDACTPCCMFADRAEFMHCST